MPPVRSKSQLIRAQSSKMAVLVSLLLCFLAALLTHEGSTLLINRVSISAIKDSLDKGEFLDALQLSEANTLGLFSDLLNDETDDASAKVTRSSLLQLGSLIEKNRFSEALEKVKGIPQFSVGVKALEELAELQKSRALKGDISVTEVESLVMRYDAISKDFADLFYNLQPSKSEKLTFYSAGVLKDLPTLPGVPDQMNTLEELRDALRASDIVAKIPKDTPNPRQYFLSRLDRIKRYSESLKGELSNAGISERSAGKTADSISRNLEAAKKDLLDKLRALINRYL